MGDACRPRHEPRQGAHHGDCSAKYGRDAPSTHHSFDRRPPQRALKPVLAWTFSWARDDAASFGSCTGADSAGG